MKYKKEIAFDWLKRYTGTDPDSYGDWILLTIFKIMLISLQRDSMLR